MYSLMMVGSRGWWDNGGTDFDLGRYLEHTDDDLKQQLQPMSADVVERLKSWPVLFAYEFSNYDEPSTQIAWVGRLSSIKVRHSTARIAFEFDPEFAPINVGQMRSILWDLDIGKYETSRTHWAVKDVNLHDVLKPKLDADGLPAPVRLPDLRVTSAAVERAIADAEHLIESGRGASSAVDRVHTTLHGYLIQLCVEGDLISPQDDYPSMTALFKKLRSEHPKLAYVGPRANEVSSALRASASIIEAINTIRNNASGAHPNEEVLPEPEAMYLINLTRSLLHYLEMKRIA
jgi:hypothetical protein